MSGIEPGSDPRFADGRGSGCSLFGAVERLTIAWIVRLVARSCHVRPNDIVGPCRAKPFVRARDIACWLARNSLPVSLPQLGRAMGGRDHTTVLSAVRRADQRRADDRVFRAQTDALLAACAALPGSTERDLEELHHAG